MDPKRMKWGKMNLWNFLSNSRLRNVKKSKSDKVDECDRVGDEYHSGFENAIDLTFIVDCLMPFKRECNFFFVGDPIFNHQIF